MKKGSKMVFFVGAEHLKEKAVFYNADDGAAVGKSVYAH